MVNAAIKSLKEREGSTRNYKVDVEKLAPFIRKYLKSAVAGGKLIQTKGKGASGSFKLAAKDKTKSDKPKAAAKKSKTTKPKKAAGEKVAKKKAASGAAKAAKKSGSVKTKAPKEKKAKTSKVIKTKAPKPKKAAKSA